MATLHLVVGNCTALGFPGGSAVKESACDAGDPGLNPGSESPTTRFPGVGNGYSSSFLTWKSPQTGDLGGLQSMGSQRFRYD